MSSTTPGEGGAGEGAAGADAADAGSERRRLGDPHQFEGQVTVRGFAGVGDGGVAHGKDPSHLAYTWAMRPPGNGPRGRRARMGHGRQTMPPLW